MASAQQSASARNSRASRNGHSSQPGLAARAQRLAKTPAVAGGAAAAGMAAGTAFGVILRGHRRPRLMGLPMPRGKEVKAGARQAARAGRWLYEVQTDVRLLREQAQQSRRQSPIEVLLSGLTSRTLPRGR
jgi:hypothetical protein